MKLRTCAIAAALTFTPVALQAQSATSAAPADEKPVEQASTSLRERLMPPAATLLLTAPAVAEKPAEAARVDSPVAVPRSAGVPLMIAGGALFVAGLIAGGDGGTVLVIAGAGIGAYGLYLYFQ